MGARHPQQIRDPAMEMNALSDPDEADALLAGYLEQLKALGWERLWEEYAEERTTLLGRHKVAGRPRERYEALVAPSGRRYGAWSWATAKDTPRLHVLVTLHEDDAAYQNVSGSMILTPDDLR